MFRSNLTMAAPDAIMWERISSTTSCVVSMFEGADNNACKVTAKIYTRL
jgi:hypothetical protein